MKSSSLINNSISRVKSGGVWSLFAPKATPKPTLSPKQRPGDKMEETRKLLKHIKDSKTVGEEQIKLSKQHFMNHLIEKLLNKIDKVQKCANKVMKIEKEHRNFFTSPNTQIDYNKNIQIFQ